MGHSASCHQLLLGGDGRRVATRPLWYTAVAAGGGGSTAGDVPSMVAVPAAVLMPRITTQSPSSPGPGYRPRHQLAWQPSSEEDERDQEAATAGGRRVLEPRRISGCVMFSQAVVEGVEGLPGAVTTSEAPATGDAGRRDEQENKKYNLPKLDYDRSDDEMSEDFVDITTEVPGKRAPESSMSVVYCVPDKYKETTLNTDTDSL